ncbi:YdcF family protein [Anaerocolumna sp. MB42-C2]|uniref:YdcF family protein n=1 Tax=Anaerocolumna sp. MB42-C2 TaxID=3070997 RepID=UPI0027DF0AE3|nr:YdcF family protein [Anaerocolumna sp. MB42-C2]WMJ90155.1 YdcF family protein [Anaerocolumna sp. MB42-C2]
MNIMAFIFLIIGLLSIGYTIAIVSYTGINTSFLWFWIIAAIGSMIIYFMLRFISAHKLEIPKYLKYGVSIMFLFGMAVFLLVEGVIICYGSKQPDSGADYVIVLGAQVKGTALSKALKNRLDTAHDYLVDNKNTKIIVSGGQGYGEDITEAKAMKEYLISKEINSSRILMEDKSTNTHENLLYSKELLPKGCHGIVIVTNRFHVFRAVSIAKKLGLDNVKCLGAPTKDILVLNYYVREFFAIVKDKLVGNI